MKIKVKSIAYHRNGVCGNGFYVVLFNEKETGTTPMLGVVFDEAGSVAVLDAEQTAAGNIVFGSNSWRGDRYEPALREACEKYEASR